MRRVNKPPQVMAPTDGNLIVYNPRAASNCLRGFFSLPLAFSLSLTFSSFSSSLPPLHFPLSLTFSFLSFSSSGFFRWGSGFVRNGKQSCPLLSSAYPLSFLKFYIVCKTTAAKYLKPDTKKASFRGGLGLLNQSPFFSGQSCLSFKLGAVLT